MCVCVCVCVCVCRCIRLMEAVSEVFFCEMFNAIWSRGGGLINLVLTGADERFAN